MPRTKISEFSATAASNTDIDSIDIAENCSPAGINDSLRAMAAMLKKMEVGTDPMTSPVLTTADINGGTYDGGAINNTPIGASTASTGAFTSLTASGAVTLSDTFTLGSTTIASSGSTLAGTVDFSGATAFTGAATFAGAVDVDDTLTANTLKIDNGSNDWSFEVVSNKLVIKYAGTSKMELDTSGNLTVVGNITAYGSI
jgi:hypothetical protein